jgi:hypothetical protein
MNHIFRGIIGKISLSLVFIALASCAGDSGIRIADGAPIPSTAEKKSFVIENYKGKADEQEIPHWVALYLDGGVRELESLALYHDYHVFINRIEGNNFTALNHWVKGFSPELDFPRLAAARIESRFLLASPLPDEEYGAFFETLIRAASDASWSGAIKEDDFWILKREEDRENVTYEFLILVTISKPDFASQFDEIFRSIRPVPPPTRNQISAANRVKDRFYDGF